MRRCRYLIIAIILLSSLLPVSAHAAAVIGKITRLTGEAYIYRKTVKKPIKVLFINMPVQLGDRVKTGAQSSLRIELKDGSILSMAEKANLNLDQF